MKSYLLQKKLSEGRNGRESDRLTLDQRKSSPPNWGVDEGKEDPPKNMASLPFSPPPLFSSFVSLSGEKRGAFALGGVFFLLVVSVGGTFLSQPVSSHTICIIFSLGGAVVSPSSQFLIFSSPLFHFVSEYDTAISTQINKRTRCFRDQYLCNYNLE